MANLVLENFPEELKAEIEKLAQKHHQSVDEQIISILKQSIIKPQTSLKFLVSPENDPTWEKRCQATPQLLADIEKRRLKRKSSEILDTTELLREDRNR